MADDKDQIINRLKFLSKCQTSFLKVRSLIFDNMQKYLLEKLVKMKDIVNKATEIAECSDQSRDTVNSIKSEISTLKIDELIDDFYQIEFSFSDELKKLRGEVVNNPPPTQPISTLPPAPPAKGNNLFFFCNL